MLVAQSCLALCNPIDCRFLGALPPEFSRKEHWNELPFPPPEDLLGPGIKSRSSALQTESLLSEPLGISPK